MPVAASRSATRSSVVFDDLRPTRAAARCLGSDDGGHTNTVFTSLLASCRMLGVEPWSYLRDLLCLLPRWPQHRVLELAPAHWAATVESEDAQLELVGRVYGTLSELDAPSAVIEAGSMPWASRGDQP